MRRQWAATESRAYGWGGVQVVSGAIHMSPNTIRKGLAELAARDSNPTAAIDSVFFLVGLNPPQPYTLAAVMYAYGVIELARSAIGIHNHGLPVISATYGVATLALPFLDDRL